MPTSARAVHVERTDGTRLVLVTREPEALHAALEEALRRRDAKLPRVRVAAVPDDERDAVAEAETDAHARREGEQQVR
jgi:hypothetical protein